MVSYNLTEDHKRILRQLVHGSEEDKLPRAFLVADIGGDWMVIDWKGDDRPELEFMDLQVLAEEDFLSLRVTANTKRGNISTVQCTLREKAFEAVRTDFIPPEPPVSTQFNIGAIINAMSGGNVQAVGIAEDTELSQVINDPALLRSQVEALTERLLDEVKSALAGNDLIEYAQAVRSLKEQLLTEEPDPSLLKRLTRTLGLLGDIEGTIGLMVRVWPYIYPLLLIAAERLG
jgi:hypothetical protein